MERHIQTILIGVCTAGVCAMASIGWEMSHKMTQQTEQISSVVHTIGELKHEVDAINDRFRLYMPREETEAKLNALRERALDHARRLERLEHREGL